MELVREKIKTSHFIGKTVSQITLEDDFNVPDIKPDVAQIIEETGEIKITEARPMDGKIQIRGKLEFSVLYIGVGSAQLLHKLSSGINFEELLNMDGLAPEHLVKVRWDMEDLRTRMINSRKISVRSIISLGVTASRVAEEEAASDQCDDASVYTLGRMLDLSQLHIQKKDIVRIKKEIHVPSAKPNMMEIIWDRVVPGKMDIKVLDGRVNIRGDMNVFLMYTSAEEENPLQYFSVPIDFNESIESPQTTEEMIGHIEPKMIQSEVNIRQNEDGEMRRAEVDVVLELSMAIYEEKHVSLMEDIYANHQKLEPVFKNLVFDNIMMQNQSMLKLAQKITVENDRAKILQICQTNANVKVDRVSMEKNGILVEGVVYIQILYIAADDKMPVNAIKGMIPFSHLIEAMGIHDKCTFEVIPSISDISSTMADSEEIDVRAELLFNTIVFEQKDIRVIVDVREESADFEALEKMPGMIGYIVRPQDTMWSIAKHFSTTKDQIMRVNQLENELLKQGQKLIIVREPMCSYIDD